MEQLCEHTTAALQTWIWIHLNQLRAEWSVEHKVIAKNFVRIQAFLWVQQMEGCPDGIGHYFLHLAHYVSLKIYVFVRKLRGQIFLKFGIAQLVGSFVLAVVVRVFLDRIVNQVDELVMELVLGQSVFFWSCPYIPDFVKICLNMAIDAGNKRKTPHIKFPILIQQRIWYIFLQNHGPPIGTSILYKFLDSVVLTLNNNTCSSVWIFAGLDNPHISQILLGSGVYFFLFLVKKRFKLNKFTIFKPFFDVKCQRQSFKNIAFTAKIIVIFHVEKQGFFVVQMVVALQLVVDFLDAKFHLSNKVFQKLNFDAFLFFLLLWSSIFLAGRLKLLLQLTYTCHIFQLLLKIRNEIERFQVQHFKYFWVIAVEFFRLGEVVIHLEFSPLSP